MATTVEGAGASVLTTGGARRRLLVSVLPGTLLSAAMTAWRFNAKPLWRDEWFTYGTVNRSFDSLLEILDGSDVGLAGYYALMHVWMLAGDSTWWLRTPSAAASVAVAALTGLLGLQLGGRLAGALSGLLVAVMPAVVTHAQEARPYPLVLTATLVVALVLLRQLERPTVGGRVALTSAAVLPGLLHPMAGALAVAGLLAGALLAPGQERRPLIALAGIPAAIVAGTLVVASHLRSDSTDADAAFGPLIVVQVHRNVADSLPLAGVLAVVTAVGLLSMFRHRAPWWPMALWCVVPTVVMTGFAMVGGYFKARYVASITPAVAVLVAIGLISLASAMASRARRAELAPMGAAAAGSLVVAVLAGPAAMFRTEPFDVDDARSAARALAAEYRPGDAVVFSGSTGRGLTHHYWPNGAQLDDVLLLEEPVSSGTLPGREVPAEEQEAVLAGEDRVWIVGTRSGEDWTSRGLTPLVETDRRRAEGRDFGGFRYELWVS